MLQNFFHDPARKRIKKYSKIKNEADKRKFEMEALLPKGIEKPKKNKLFSFQEEKVVKIVLPNKEALSLFKKYFRVTKKIELSITAGVELLLAFLTALENKELIYNEEENKIKPAPKKSHKRIKKMGKKMPKKTP